jgi:hypothetical protein
MGYGEERRSTEVRIVSVRPLDRRHELKMRWLRRAATVTVVAGVAVAALGR